MIVVVMGVSGSGKTSIGRAIAAGTGWTFIEGDDLHPPANRAKMASGTPLDDDDRWPWLDAIAAAAATVLAGGGTAVIACSALKRSYRDRLRAAGPDVKFIHLTGNRRTIQRRMAARRNHFMPPGLLDSQFASLEPPDPDEDCWTLSIAAPVADSADRAIQHLRETSPSAPVAQN